MQTQHALKLLVVGLSAACGLVVEIVAGRMVAPYLGMSLYTWTAIISVVLAGFSLGHWIGGRLAERPDALALRSVAWSLLLAGLSTIATLVTIRHAAPTIIGMNLGAVPTVLLVTSILFFLPSLFVGIPSPVLTKLALDEDEAGRSGRTIGAFYAVSAVGSIGGTLAAGFLFISWLGTTNTLVVVSALYLLMGLALFAGRAAGGLSCMWRPVAVVLIATLFIGYLGVRVQAFTDPCRISSSYYCIRIADVSREFRTPARVMVLDHLGHGVNLKEAPQRLVSPYVELHDILARTHVAKRTSPHAFFIGGGAYTLPRAWLDARRDAVITVAEIDPAVTRAAFSEMWLTPVDRLRTIHADARIALQKAGASKFDIIVGDAFHDIVIPPHLVTLEFFKLVADRLSKDGLYLMNVVDHQLRPRLALSIWRTMRATFPNVEMWRSNETGTRTTFVLAAVAQPTPRDLIATPSSPGVTFRRLPKTALQRLVREVQPLVLTDDYAPVDRIIGVE